MDSYLDIKVLPDPEISGPALLNNLFAKLHRALVQQEQAQNKVAVSFPQYGKNLGTILRLHGLVSDLDSLMGQNWLKGLKDYTRVSDILPVPESVKGYRTVFRVQQKSPYNIRKRSVAKGHLTEEEALKKYPDAKQKILSKPFIRVKSQSTGQEIYLFIDQGKLQKSPTLGQFSYYGLSRSATVPCF